jgi:hypothetical protein
MWACVPFTEVLWHPEVRRMSTSGVAILLAQALNSVAFAFWGHMYLFKETRWITAYLARSISFMVIGAIYTVLALSGAIGEAYVGAIIYFIWGIVIGSPVVVLMYRRRMALQAALRAIKQDQARYDEAWCPVKEGQAAALRSLSQLVAQHQSKRKEQSTTVLKLLYEQAVALDDWYQNVVRSWAQHCNALHSPAPVKTYRRTLEKVYRSYSGRVPPITDLVRSTIVVETIEQAQEVAEIVLHDATVYTIKNRFDLTYDGCATAGYRDLNLQIGFPEMDDTLFEGFVFELQIHLRAVIEMKTEFGHKRYIALRNLRGD